MSDPKPPKPKGGARPGAGRKPSALKAEHNALFDAAWPVDRRQAAIKRLSELAETGEPDIALKAAEILLNRVYGKPTERKEVSGPDGGAVAIVQTFGKALDTAYADDPDPAPNNPG